MPLIFFSVVNKNVSGMAISGELKVLLKIFRGNRDHLKSKEKLENDMVRGD